MATSERFEGLSAQEVSVLRAKRRSALLMLVTTPLVYLFFAGVAIFSGSWLYITLYFVLTTLPVLVVWLGAILSLLSLNRDIREGKKKILVSRVESQRQDIRDVGRRNNVQMSYKYLIKVNGKEMQVSEAQYYQCKPGQMVEIQLAPESKHVFALNVQKEAALDSDSPVVSA